MPEPAQPAPDGAKTPLDRLLSIFTDVRAGEGTTALLMLINIFALLICYSIIKIVREPLILLGGGAEMRSYTAAGQALVLMGFVPVTGSNPIRTSAGPAAVYDLISAGQAL